MYILSTGIASGARLPKDLPTAEVTRCMITLFGLWNWDGTLDRIHHALYLKCRVFQPRAEASPTACIIDSQRS